MRILYTIGIQCYAIGVHIAATFNSKAKLMVEGWKETFGQLAMAPVGKGNTAWFHASSLGEFEQARPVLEQFRRTHPEYRICVTFFSPSGYEVRKKYPEADFICYLPMDTRANARRFVNLLHPTVVFFAKYDFWFNYLEQLRLRDIPTFIFSSIFRPNQYFFKPYGKWFLKQVRQCFTHIFVQNEESQHLLQKHGFNNVSIAGDTRFDRVYAIAQESRRFAEVENFLRLHPDNKVLLAGSSWEPDEANLKKYIDHRGEGLTLVIAPHVTEESHISHIVNLFGRENCTRYSQIASANPSSKILIIDTIGILASLYQYAYVAYIGGGFGRGIHNTLEAITFGKPVVFGPNYQKFKEAKDIISLGGGFSYSQYDQLEQTLDSLLDNEELYRQSSEVCTQYLTENLGSSEKILSTVSRYIKKM